MLLSREIRRKLAALRDGATGDAAPDLEEETLEQLDRPVDVVAAPDELPPGKEVHGDLGRCFSIRLRPSWTGDWADVLAAECWTVLTRKPSFAFTGPHQTAFIDIETTGLSSLPLFLVGILHAGPGGLHLHQFLARDYTEEPAVLAAAADLLRHARLLISFNGRSFDMPYIRDRLRYHRLDQVIAVEHHWDVLLTARRRLRDLLPDRSLLTLEEHLCRRRRGDDIPSHQIPRAYHDYVATGDNSQLGRILYHNQVDLLTTAQLAALWADDMPVQTDD